MRSLLARDNGLQDTQKQSRKIVPTTNVERRRRGEELILRVAEEVFANRGFQGATMTEIGKRAGLPKANIHYYFSSKARLYQRVIDDVFTVWLKAADQFDDHDNPREALTAYISAKMELSRSRPNGSKVWANEIIHGAPMIRDYLETHVREWCASREARIQSWIDRGMMRPVNARYLLYMIWASTQHFADFGTQITVLNNGKPLSDEAFEEAKQTLVDIFLGGLLYESK
jgi:TetR/AcrR family transcriptional regulator